ncbi:cell division protein FtsL [Marinicrinis sediminis]|uniref:Cell division protein FtsL n=1 Tax=Marinicrinis sediminis TaxID=1652465 RepID=A0ABW5RC85_9BACL
MSPYYDGNLALEPQRKKQQTTRIRETKKVVKRIYTIPMAEKLLYLFTVMICVAVAGSIIFKYAQIYDVNTRIQEMEKQIRVIESNNDTLQLQARALKEPKRLVSLGEQMGFIYVNEETVKQVKPE